MRLNHARRGRCYPGITADLARKSLSVCLSISGITCTGGNPEGSHTPERTRTDQLHRTSAAPSLLLRNMSGREECNYRCNYSRWSSSQLTSPHVCVCVWGGQTTAESGSCNRSDKLWMHVHPSCSPHAHVHVPRPCLQVCLAAVRGAQTSHQRQTAALPAAQVTSCSPTDQQNQD